MKFLPPNDINMIVLIVIDDMLTLCFASTAMSVPMFTSGCSEYHDDRPVDGKGTEV